MANAMLPGAWARNASLDFGGVGPPTLGMNRALGSLTPAYVCPEPVEELEVHEFGRVAAPLRPSYACPEPVEGLGAYGGSTSAGGRR